MKSQTSLVASQVRLQHWAEQIKDCQNRPEDMDVNGTGINSSAGAVIKGRNGLSIELYNTASQELIQKILGACAYAQ